MMVQLLYDWPTFGGLMGLNLATQGNGTRRMIASSVFTTDPIAAPRADLVLARCAGMRADR
jgi:hypothetical protein